MTTGDLDLLKGDAEAISKLGDHWTFEWKLENCAQYGYQVFSCGIGTPTKLNETDIASVTFDARRLTERSFNSVQEHTQIALMILIEGRQRQVVLDYRMKDCRISVQ